MKALIRKYPINARSPENNEVWIYPWKDADEQGRPYTLEGYRYAYCENCPEIAEGEDPPSVDHFEVREIEIEETDETGEIRKRTVYVAVYIG